MASLELALVQMMNDYSKSNAQRREQIEKLKKDAVTTAAHVSELLVDSVNSEVQESFTNEKRIEFETRALASTVQRYTKQTHQWITVVRALDTALKGCDGSILLDDTVTFKGEKSAGPNANSLRGYEVIDIIKSRLESVCSGVVSCADIVAIAARDSVVELGGPTWAVQLGRRDSTSASLNSANTLLPSPFANLSALISAFQSQGLSTKDMIALSGAHTIGQARCLIFRSRIYKESNIDMSFASSIQANCPNSGGDNNISPLDAVTPDSFDNSYYKNLRSKRGLLHSDQVLFDGGSADGQVATYSMNPYAFFSDFATAMLNMGNIRPLTGISGEIRKDCRTIN